MTSARFNSEAALRRSDISSISFSIFVGKKRWKRIAKESIGKGGENLSKIRNEHLAKKKKRVNSCLYGLSIVEIATFGQHKVVPRSGMSNIFPRALTPISRIHKNYTLPIYGRNATNVPF